MSFFEEVDFKLIAATSDDFVLAKIGSYPFRNLDVVKRIFGIDFDAINGSRRIVVFD